MIVTVCPATVSVPLRGLPAGFASTVNATVPLPVPFVPLVIVIQPALLEAVHAHALLVVTDAVDEPPAAGMLCGVGAAVKLHTSPPCVTTNVRPATDTVPVRNPVARLGAMSIATVPLPVPLAPLVIVSQLELLVAVQLQPAVVVTEVEVDPAADPAPNDVGEMLYVHATTL